jgi:hypothetical protein
MFGHRIVRFAAVSLALYGVLGLAVAAALVVVGFWTFDQVRSVQRSVETQRIAVVQSIRTVSSAVQTTAGATTDVKRSIDSARGAADQASMLANDSAGTFRDMGVNLGSLTIFGIQPLTGITPQFDKDADQFQQLAIALGNTREALGQNSSDVQRVGGDLSQVQSQLDALATSLNQPIVFGMGANGLLPFQAAFFGVCALIVIQSAMSIAASVVLFRLQRAMGQQPLFVAPRLGPPAPAGPERLSAVR